MATTLQFREIVVPPRIVSGWCTAGEGLAGYIRPAVVRVSVQCFEVLLPKPKNLSRVSPAFYFADVQVEGRHGVGSIANSIPSRSLHSSTIIPQTPILITNAPLLHIQQRGG